MRVTNTSDAYKAWGWLHFHCGDSVHREDDPRHIGRVKAVRNSIYVDVVWNDNGWQSEELATDLVKYLGPPCSTEGCKRQVTWIKTAPAPEAFLCSRCFVAGAWSRNGPEMFAPYVVGE